jgi:hypothetical protein
VLQNEFLFEKYVFRYLLKLWILRRLSSIQNVTTIPSPVISSTIAATIITTATTTVTTISSAVTPTTTNAITTTTTSTTTTTTLSSLLGEIEAAVSDCPLIYSQVKIFISGINGIVL